MMLNKTLCIVLASWLLYGCAGAAPPPKPGVVTFSTEGDTASSSTELEYKNQPISRDLLQKIDDGIYAEELPMGVQPDAVAAAAPATTDMAPIAWVVLGGAIGLITAVIGGAIAVSLWAR